MLPNRTPQRAGLRRGHREVIDAIAFKFQTGTERVHLPETYADWRGVHNRLRMWTVDGTLGAGKAGAAPAFTVVMARLRFPDDAAARARIRGGGLPAPRGAG